VGIHETRDEPVDGRIEPDGDEETDRQMDHVTRDRPEERDGAGPAIVGGHHVEEHVARKRERHHDTATPNGTESNPAAERRREGAKQDGREETMSRTVVKEPGLPDQDARNEIEIGGIPGNHEGGSQSYCAATPIGADHCWMRCRLRAPAVAAEPFECKSREAVNNR
jgi:hypothetical protein